MTRIEMTNPAFVFRSADGVTHLVRRDLRSTLMRAEREMVEITSNPSILGIDAPMDYARKYVGGMTRIEIVLDFSRGRPWHLLFHDRGREIPFALCVPREARYTGIGQITEIEMYSATLLCSRVELHR